MSPEEQKQIESLASGLRFANITVNNLIDCGDFGCVFRTNKPGIVAKIGRQWSEDQFARQIIEQNLQHPHLPQILAVIDLREAIKAPYYVIIREDISDLMGVNMHWFNEILADLDYRADEAEDSEEIIDMAEEMLAERPGLPSDELIFEKIADLTAWCFDHGILLGDTLASNFGRGLNGEVKLRDLGGTRFRGSDGAWR
jgi:hypothetical protein